MSRTGSLLEMQILRKCTHCWALTGWWKSEKSNESNWRKRHNKFSVPILTPILAPFPQYIENDKSFRHAVCAKMCPISPSNGIQKIRKIRWGKCEKSCIMCFQYYSGTLFWLLFRNISRTERYFDMRFAPKCAHYDLLMVWRKWEKIDEATARKVA